MITLQVICLDASVKKINMRLDISQLTPIKLMVYHACYVFQIYHPLVV